MSSRIATKFLSLPILTSEISDLVWKLADLSKATEVFCAPTEKYAQELVTLLDGPKIAEVVSLIPSAKTIDSLITENMKMDLAKSIVSNRFTNKASLDKILTLFPTLESEILERTELQRIDFIENSIFSIRILEQYIADNQLSKFFAQVASYGEKKMSDLFKSLYNYDQKLASLVLHTALETGNKLDILMLDYAYSVKSYMNEAVIIKLEHDFTNLNKLSGKVTPAAFDYLVEKGYLVLKKEQATKYGTDEQTAKTLLATGLDEATVATLLLGSNKSELDSNFLTDMLAKASNGLISQFITGASERKPKPGEITKLFNKLGTDRVSKIISEYDEVVTSLDWSEELILAAPLIEIANLGTSGTAKLFWSVESKLGSDQAAWELFLIMSEEWEDSVDSLMNSANIMSVLA